MQVKHQERFVEPQSTSQDMTDSLSPKRRKIDSPVGANYSCSFVNKEWRDKVHAYIPEIKAYMKDAEQFVTNYVMNYGYPFNSLSFLHFVACSKEEEILGSSHLLSYDRPNTYGLSFMAEDFPLFEEEAGHIQSSANSSLQIHGDIQTIGKSSTAQFSESLSATATCIEPISTQVTNNYDDGMNLSSVMETAQMQSVKAISFSYDSGNYQFVGEASQASSSSTDYIDIQLKDTFKDEIFPQQTISSSSSSIHSTRSVLIDLDNKLLLKSKSCIRETKCGMRCQNSVME